MSRRHVARALAALGLLAASGGAAHAGVAWFDGTVDEALDAARRDGKLVLVDCWATWCTYCHQMDREVWSDADLARSLAPEVVAVRAEVDIFRDVGSDLQRRYDIDGLPVVLVLDPEDGAELARIAGFAGPELVLATVTRAWRQADPSRAAGGEPGGDAAGLLAAASRAKLSADVGEAVRGARAAIEADALCSEDVADDAALLVAELLAPTGDAAAAAEVVARAASACSRADRGAELWSAWARLAAATEGPEAAGRVLDQKVALFPRSGEALVEYVDWALDASLGEAGRRVAERRAEAAAELLPDDTRPLSQLARLRLARGEPAAAMEALERAIAIDPHDPVLRRLRLDIMLRRASDG